MPVLSIVPAAAVADSAVTDTQLRVLCAIGTFTNRLGGNVWASVGTLAKACNLSIRTVQRAVPALIEAGYLRRTERMGRTPVYEVVLEREAQGVSAESEGGVTGVTPPPSQQSPKREEERYTKRSKKSDMMALFEAEQFRLAMADIWTYYPPRPEPHRYVPARQAVAEAVQAGAPLATLVNAAKQYAQHVLRNQTESRYVRGMASFFRDGVWEQYAQITVHGRTREEWARSGQDVSEFDRLARGAA
jgi:DNA-binding transcriptional ArsR family regulator